MERDMDMVRNILIAVEEHPDPDGWAPVAIDGVDAQVISYHVKLLNQAGLLEADDLSTSNFEWKPVSLTWHGHEFLDSVRDDSHWAEAKEVLSRLGNSSFAILTQVVTKFAIERMA